MVRQISEAYRGYARSVLAELPIFNRLHLLLVLLEEGISDSVWTA